LENESKQMGVSVVVRDCGGREVAALAMVIPFINDPSTAEALGAKKHIRQLHHNKLEEFPTIEIQQQYKRSRFSKFN